MVGLPVYILLDLPPTSNSNKWSIICIYRDSPPENLYNNPGGDWNPWWGVDPRHSALHTIQGLWVLPWHGVSIDKLIRRTGAFQSVTARKFWDMNTFYCIWHTIVHMSNCVYLLWWKLTLCGVKQGSSKCWFRLQNEIKTRWGDSKNEIGFDVYHIYEHVVINFLGSTYDIPQLVLEWYSRIKTKADKETGRWPTKWGGKKRDQNEIRTRSDPTPTRHPTSHCRTGQVLGISPKS